MKAEPLTVELIRARRAAILRSLDVPENQLRERAAIYALNARELAALQDIDGLDYLLHGVPTTTEENQP